jgi:hypothetical protein
MTVLRDYADGSVLFHCDTCSELLETSSQDFTRAVRILRREGWVFLPPDSHQCQSCSRADDLADLGGL